MFIRPTTCTFSTGRLPQCSNVVKNLSLYCIEYNYFSLPLKANSSMRPQLFGK